jgi:hypothetical protein
MVHTGSFHCCPASTKKAREGFLEHWILAIGTSENSNPVELIHFLFSV